MKLNIFTLFILILINAHDALSKSQTTISIEWKIVPNNAKIEVRNGRISGFKVPGGAGEKVSDLEFTISDGKRIEVKLDSVNMDPGSNPTIITVYASTGSFSFFLRDVTKTYPIYIPNYQVVVLPADDLRSYESVENEVLSRETRTKIQRISDLPEEPSFDNVKERTRDMSVPTWLGISRDTRMFQITEALPDAQPGEANIISPLLGSYPLVLSDIGSGPVNYLYSVGRGVGVEDNISRRLEEGVMPILKTTLIDDDIVYNSLTFVSLENSELLIGSQYGTDFLIANSQSGGSMFTDPQKELLSKKKEAMNNATEETVLYFRTEAVNHGDVPRYAWFKIPRPGNAWYNGQDYVFDSKTGFSSYLSGDVFAVSKLNGLPIKNEELAVLLQPGENAVVEFYVPHKPISTQRAHSLQRQNFKERLDEAKRFWFSKLEEAGKIRLPEERIEEMIQAGLLHLDLITFGKDPDKTLGANIGGYSPIGTESSPIIQFYNSIGWSNVAKRSVDFFLEKQHENGFIQNFGGYMVETGAALWTMGEYVRYTNDIEWAQTAAPKLLKSADYLIDWRNQNEKSELRGFGHGMIAGKVADPEDHFHQFMLNGYAYLGMSRVAEILKLIDSEHADRISNEAAAWREDIRESFFNVMALSPVVPLGDGTWCSTVPPWSESLGLRALYLESETFWSHGTFTTSDALLGPLYLVFCEVIDVNEPVARMLLDYHSELFFQGNAAFSQPYYSRHNWIQAKLGMTKPFLDTYYSTVSALADRETYSFWEHLYKLTPHKTHEEAWFLMETRWMLYMEDGDQLDLFKTIPRAWMADGERILLDGVWSYFGPIRVEATSNVNSGHIDASIECSTDRKPSVVRVRLPHPENKKPVQVIGGTYDEKTETVIVSDFDGTASVRLVF